MFQAFSARFARLCSLSLVLTALSVDSIASTSILVSVPEQKLVVVRDGERVAQYRISTSRFGLGDKPRSFATPLGRLEIADRLGAGLPPGAVFKRRYPTGEVLSPNAKGRDPIVTRILHLRGLEARNENAFARAIYIHGTPVERTIGKPDSYGCIRMRSQDVIELFDLVPTGTTVEIVDERVSQVLPGMLAASRPSSAPIAAAAEFRFGAAVQLAGKSSDLLPASLMTASLTATSWSAAARSSAQGKQANGTAVARRIDLSSVTELPSLGGVANLHASR